YGRLGHSERLFDTVGSIIEAGQNVAMHIHHEIRELLTCTQQHRPDGVAIWNSRRECVRLMIWALTCRLGRSALVTILRRSATQSQRPCEEGTALKSIFSLWPE